MRTIMLVDDSAMIQALYRQVLGRRKELRIVSATNGKEALDRIAAEGEPSLILLDVNMPVCDGLSFLEQSGASGLPARVPIVVVSTEGTDADVARGIALGARAYLRKPFRPQELTALVDRLLPPEQASAPQP